MKSAKQFLQQIDEFKVEATANVVKSKLTESTTKEELESLVESSSIEAYKRKSLVEYLDKNKDKLLAMDVYSEGDPVQVSDQFAPHARKHGKVISHGAATGTYKVEFEDGQYDVPAHHISRRDVVANEAREDQSTDGHSGEKKKIHKLITEQRCFALLEDGSLIKVIVESVDGSDRLVAEQVGQQVVVVFPVDISESFVASLTESEMTDEQKANREEIVIGMKKNKTDLMKRYGDRWESVMYAVATKKAMGESLAEASDEVVFQRKSGDVDVMIVKDGEYFRLKRVGPSGEVIDTQEFDNIKDAETAAQF